MRVVLWIALVALVLASVPTRSDAAGDPPVWRREVLLGVGAESYMVWVATWEQPGVHYVTSETVSIEVRRLPGRELVAHHPLLGRAYRFRPEENLWAATRASEPAFDLAEFFQANQVAPALPTNQFDGLTASDSGLVFERWKHTVVVVGVAEIRKQLGPPGQRLRVLGTYEASPAGREGDSAYLFVLLQSLETGESDHWSERLLVVPYEKVFRAWMTIHAYSP